MIDITCIEDLRVLHEKRTPRMFYDYVDSGSWTESTYRDNEAAYRKLKLKQRVMVDMDNRSINTRMLGEQVSMPTALAPVGLTGMQWVNGEIQAAKAAEKFGVPFSLSTMSICSIEDVAAAASKPFWFQLYIMKDRAFIKKLILRAKSAGCSALILTADLQIMGQRHKDIRNGLSVPPQMTLGSVTNIAMHPMWCLRMLSAKRYQFGNVIGHATGAENLKTLAQWSAEQLDPTVNWEDVKWVKDIWQGPLVIKGIMCAEDALLAASAGAEAIVVSNHGGRQLDGAPATIDVLPEIVRAVKGKTEIWVDGGIRTGQDMFRAMALGADSTMIGRAYQHGLGAMGEAGVTRALELMAKEFDLTMAFCGLRDVHDVDERVIIQ
ncbi:MAG: alpha-hydroxy-acid oxidizing protein [Pseudomonadales bacterium]|nr:alpha-hydroxy-acid oxidizing protein [Pseudomonadales bacterium]MBO6564354.1 alpha-hydroxy-acid oxidizing protein [Pseudomonadales bacterium]MBO6595437.1 alpha-hydroxy-acid oxidizing protein [Pseudomonadales bacterium]MBO6657560.1 alpha-hydroxy-acid oxidizing protein [Pseudomonadales bacterium]MBO6701937.1 alpha-hydroxy-acid oxidizing protein [Pseudomonadales bacterium]